MPKQRHGSFFLKQKDFSNHSDNWFQKRFLLSIVLKKLFAFQANQTVACADNQSNENGCGQGKGPENPGVSNRGVESELNFQSMSWSTRGSKQADHTVWTITTTLTHRPGKSRTRKSPTSLHMLFRSSSSGPQQVTPIKPTVNDKTIPTDPRQSLCSDQALAAEILIQLPAVDDITQTWR